MQNCGFCSMVSDFLCRTLCVGSRRGSSDTYYRELGDQDTLRIDDNKSCSSSSFSNDVEEIIHASPSQERRHSNEEEIANMKEKAANTGRFLTLTRSRRRFKEPAGLDALLVDGPQLRQLKRYLNKSALWRFSAFRLENISKGRSLPVLCVHLFETYGLISHYKLDVAKLWKLFFLIEEGYHTGNPYHNAVHAADVTQAMHCFLQQKQILPYMQPQEILACILAASAHDLDHPGVNQAFLIASSNYLANLYHNTSVLENHHWRAAASCMIESGLLEDLGDIWGSLKRQVSALILATDISLQQDYLSLFQGYMDTNTLDLKKSEHRFLVMQIALKCADISNPCRPWEISKEWSRRVCEEFYRQGDYERNLKLPVSPLCDRNKSSMAKIQTGFFKFIVTPLITEWDRFLHNRLSSQMRKNLLYNQYKWEATLSVEMKKKSRNAAANSESEDGVATGSGLSGSSELLLPGRRCSLTPMKPKGFKEHLRRLSVPLNFFQDKKVKSRASTSSEMRHKSGPLSAEGSSRSQDAKFRWLKKSEPSVASTSGGAAEEGIQREFAAVGSQLRDNLSTVKLGGLDSEPLMARRKSMPAEAAAMALEAPKERKVRDLAAAIPQFFRRNVSGNESRRHRRGSAPAPVAVSELGGLAQGTRGSASDTNGALKKPSTMATGQPASGKSSRNIQEPPCTNIIRRSSLPIEGQETTDKMKKSHSN